jgi:hypothetical protein
MHLEICGKATPGTKMCKQEKGFLWGTRRESEHGNNAKADLFLIALLRSSGFNCFDE